MLLTDELDDEIEYGDVILGLDMSYDNILRLYDVLEDEHIDTIEKIEITLEMLIFNFYEVEDLNLEEKYELFKFILKNFIDEDIDAKKKSEEEQKNSPNSSDKKKFFDFSVDAERIFASFMMDYKIDLIHLQGKLHWKKFIALFNGLSDDTPFKKVVNIREMDIPSPTQHNAKERAEIIKLKDLYSLESKEEKTNRLNTAFAVMKSKAQQNKKVEKEDDS